MSLFYNARTGAPVAISADALSDALGKCSIRDDIVAALKLDIADGGYEL